MEDVEAAYEAISVAQIRKAEMAAKRDALERGESHRRSTSVGAPKSDADGVGAETDADAETETDTDYSEDEDDEEDEEEGDGSDEEVASGGGGGTRVKTDGTLPRDGSGMKAFGVHSNASVLASSDLKASRSRTSAVVTEGVENVPTAVPSCSSRTRTRSTASGDGAGLRLQSKRSGRSEDHGRSSARSSSSSQAGSRSAAAAAPDVLVVHAD